METLTRKYVKKSYFSKMMSATKHEAQFNDLLAAVKGNASDLNLALSADTHQIASDNAAALQRVEAGQHKMAAKRGYADYEEHDMVTVLSESEINEQKIRYQEDKHFAEGGFGKVWRGDYDGEKVAVKKVSKLLTDDNRRLFTNAIPRRSSTSGD